MVSSLRTGTAEWLYDTLYCARGQAENPIKLHKGQLAPTHQLSLPPWPSGPPGAAHRSLLADAERARRHPPNRNRFATAEFATLHMRLIKIAGRITETATRVRITFAAACPEAELFRGIARSLQPTGP